MQIKSKNIEMIDVEAIVPNPKNANRHSIEQIERLTKMIKFQGFRNPLVISNRSGFLIVGHGRLEAAKNLGMKQVPVIYQDFESEAQEYSYLVGDNEIARWSELDKHAVIEEMKLLELDDVEMLGLEFDFVSASDLDLDAELANAGISMDDEDITDGVKKAIQIEFNLEDYEEAQELIKWYRQQGAYVGEIILNFLRMEKENYENN